MSPVHLALIWHQHQPYYRDLFTGRSRMPWVRLHAVKDYYGMARLIEEAHEAGLQPRVTVNLVPSLLDQLERYAAGEATDPHLEVTSPPAADLDADQRAAALDLLFQANWENMIRIHPRYGELLSKRQPGKARAADMVGEFSDQELLDLQVWANLAWFHETVLEHDEDLRALIEKDRDFTEDEKAHVLRRQREVAGEVIPLHRRLQDEGVIEITTTPYYHPILPLLCDVNAAHEALPGTPLPAGHESLAEDARTQLARAVEAGESRFGRRPQGLWPSEGSVSPAMMQLAAEAGFAYLATDEEILAESLGITFERDGEGLVRPADKLYTPYRYETPAGPLTLLFRDHRLSDLIGFDYQHVEPERAAADFAARVRACGAAAGGTDPLVTVILDGENAWEYYPQGGVPFLRALYRGLGRDGQIALTRAGDALDARPPTRTLPRLHSGSWINHDFYIWIGHEDDVRAWEYVFRVRRDLKRFEAEGGLDADARARAWESLYIAEGSDWTWWYGDDHNSGQDDVFDELFRTHLGNVYRFAGKPVPPFLDTPVPARQRAGRIRPPRALLDVVLDGRVTHYYEWALAGRYRPAAGESRAGAGGTMRRGGGGLLDQVFFGFSLDTLYLRVDLVRDWRDRLAARGGSNDWRLRAHVSAVEDHVLDVRGLAEDSPELWLHAAGAPDDARRVAEIAERLAARRGETSASGIRRRSSGWTNVRQFAISEGSAAALSPLHAGAAVDDVVELACPFAALGLRPDQHVHFHVELIHDGAPAERLPGAGELDFVVPNDDFEATNWHV